MFAVCLNVRVVYTHVSLLYRRIKSRVLSLHLNFFNKILNYMRESKRVEFGVEYILILTPKRAYRVHACFRRARITKFAPIPCVVYC